MVLNIKSILLTSDNSDSSLIPEEIQLDYNFGYLIGAYAADGCTSNCQISISNNDAQYFEPILKLCQQWNVDTKIYKNENNTSQDLRIDNTLLCHLVEQCCGKLSHNKFVEDRIIFSNRECLLGFLDAYIGGDGAINKKDKSIVMSSVSKDLLIDVQQILNILGIYSFITKTTKTHKLCVRNQQANKLASILNLKLEYKQEQLQIISRHTPKYEYNKNTKFVPDEVNGEIVFKERNESYADVLFDKIISIEEVSNTTNYAYDLTIADTLTFNIYNGLALDDTFHFAGVASKSNVTRGVPRIEEILSLSASIKNPSLTVFLKPDEQTDKDKASTIQYMLEHTKLEEVVKSVEICFDPDDLNTLIVEDKSTMSQYREFEDMIDECLAQEASEEESEKSKWIIRMEIDPEVMLEKNITMDDINFTLNNSYKDEITCVYSDYNADKLVFRIRMRNILKNSSGKGSKKAKLNPLDQSDQIYILKNFQEQLLNGVVLRGIKNINKVILRKMKDTLIESAGA